MKKPTIYEIKYATLKSSPHYFSRETMKFFGQTLKDFSVYKTSDPNKFLISAKIKGTEFYSKRIFNAITKELETL